MATQPGQAALFSPSEYQSIPMDADDDKPSAPSKDLAQIAENQCLTIEEIDEAYDAERWNK
jgi:hypothetical protein